MIVVTAIYQRVFSIWRQEMAREIERKFLLINEEWKELSHQKTHLAQAYLNDISKDGSKSSVRIRIEGDKANINIKSLEIGISRDEYEYAIPIAEAKKMIATLAVGPVIEKYRYLVNFGKHLWEIDAFLGDNKGLVVAEVELESEQSQPELPSWAGKEVTEFSRYYNISLSQQPFNQWTDDERNF